LTPGAKLSPGGEFCALGVKFSARPSILLNSRECSPLGGNEGMNITPGGQISPLGVKLIMALSNTNLGATLFTKAHSAKIRMQWKTKQNKLETVFQCFR
jgi:hypothetical protein